jgi:hypothetical protein
MSELGAIRGVKFHYLRHAGPEHVLCYAPTRSGKGVGLIVPTLLSWKQSVFVTDLKGELYELTAGWRHEHAHNRILRFEPAAAAGSCCFNPMEELRIGTEHEVGDAQNLAFIDCRSGWERASSGQPLAKDRLFATGRLHPAPVLQGQSRRNASDLYRARPNAGGFEPANPKAVE